MRMPARCGVVVVAAGLAIAGASSAEAGRILDRVKAEGVVRCGAAPRPGLLEQTAQGAHGLLADLCRAIAVAALGPSARAALDVYDSDRAFDAVRDGRDEVFFLSGSDIVGQRLAGRVLPGPTVFLEKTALMVPAASPARHLDMLADQPICFEQGTDAHRTLEAWFAERRLPFIRMGYQEPDEMHDAYDSGVCHALAGEATALAALRSDGDPHRRGSRILPEPLARFAIVAATGLDDAAWSADVAWIAMALIDAQRPTGAFKAGGADSLPLDGPAIGLVPDWQKQMLAATGSYDAMTARTVGPSSPLALSADEDLLPATPWNE